MAEGQVYTTLESLLKSTEIVKFNNYDNTTSEKIQQVDKNIILSLWNRLSGTSVTNITYENLLELYNNSSLITGSFYKITDYKTVHLIGGTSEYNDTTTTYDSGTGIGNGDSLTSFSPEVEPLILQALSPNSFNIQVLSPNNPTDIIYYNIEDNKTEDGLRDRNGYIVYRKDVIYNNETPYDFRNVLNRRYDVDTSFDRTIDLSIFLDNSSYDSQFQFDTTAMSNSGFVPSLVHKEVTTGLILAGNYKTPRVSTTFRDLKTFVGQYDNGGVLLGRTIYMRNISLTSNHAGTSTITGSGSSYDGVNVPEIYGRNPNVVIASEVAHDISIGANCNGVTILQGKCRSINIGNGCEGINIGGTYQGNQIFSYYVDDVTIGDYNSQICISTFSVKIEIGDANVGINLFDTPTEVKIGHINRNIFAYSPINFSIQDRNVDILSQTSWNYQIGDDNSTFRLLQNNGSTGGDSNLHPDVSPPNFPYTVYGDRVDYTIPSYPTLPYGSVSKSIIRDSCKNIIVQFAPSIKVGSKCENITVERSARVSISDFVRKCKITSSNNTEVGDNSSDVIIRSASFGLNFVGKNSTGIQISGSLCSVGNFCNNILLLYDAARVEVGNSCNNNYITSCFNSRLGNNCNNNIIRGSQVVTLGDRCNDNFFEYSSNNLLKGDCNSNTFNNCDTRYIINYPPISNLYDYTLSDFESKIKDSLTQEAGLGNPIGSINNILGNSCNNNYFVSSNNNTLEDNCNNNGFSGYSTKQVTRLFTCDSLGDNPGTGTEICNLTPADTSTVLIPAVGSDDNIFESKVSDIKLLGNTRSLNKIYTGISGITIDSGAISFSNNTISFVPKVIAPITFNSGTITENKEIRYQSPDGTLWELSIDNSGSTSTNSVPLV